MDSAHERLDDRLRRIKGDPAKAQCFAALGLPPAWMALSMRSWPLPVGPQAPPRPHYDSVHSSVEDWARGVEDLLREVHDA